MTAAEQLIEEGQLQAKIQVAINCLREGIQIDTIAKITDLPIEQINDLAKEHSIS